jgi:hypothetical protein
MVSKLDEFNRVGIITVINLNNYGSVLQAYALQKVLLKLGYESEIIRYIIKHTPLVLLGYFINSLKNYGCIITLKFTLNYSEQMLNKKIKSFQLNDSDLIASSKLFNEFKKDRLSIGTQEYTPLSLKLSPPSYSIYITGSDNVWKFNNNHGISDGNARCYLDFVPKDRKRISYAASMADPNVADINLKRFIDLLDNIEYISVREIKTAELISKLIKKPVKIVCDPTLLLSIDEWDTLCSNYPLSKIKSQFLLVYIIYPVNEDEDILLFVDYISEKLGLAVKNIGYYFKSSKPLYNNVSIPEFLQYFKNASLIVTNTFHGTMFSIIYRRSFYTFRPPEGETRIRDILQITDLSNRFVGSLSEAKALPTIIEYMPVEDRINQFRDESLVWLDHSLHDSKIPNYGE